MLLSGVCDEIQASLKAWLCWVGSLFESSPAARTGSSVPLRLAARRHPAERGLRSNGPVPEGEAG